MNSIRDHRSDVPSNEAKSRLVALALARVDVEVPLHPEPAEHDLTLGVQVGGLAHRQLVLAAAAVAANVIKRTADVADVDSAKDAVRVAKKWARGGLVPRPKSLRRLRKQRDRLAQRAMAVADYCRLAAARGADSDHGLELYAAPSIELTRVRAAMDCCTCALSLWRVIEGGRPKALWKLIHAAGRAQAALLAARLLAEPATAANASAYGAIEGAKRAPHAIAFERASWLASCAGLDILETAAGEAAMVRYVRSSFWFIRWAMTETLEATVSVVPDACC